MKLENAQDELKPLLRDIGVPESKLKQLSFGRMNQSIRREDIQIDSHQSSIIIERYQRDFEIFQYDLDF